MRRLLSLLALFLALCFPLFLPLAHAQEYLDPAVAFKPSVRAIDGRTIEVGYEIADGYYLYRDKFRFKVEGDAARLGTPVYPAGKMHSDENFGKVEVYYDAVAIRIPVERNATGTLPLTLKVTAQGCADQGVCYPPNTQTVRVELPDPASAPAAPAPGAGAGDDSGKIAATLMHAGFWANLAFFFVAGIGLSLTPCMLPMIPILSGIIAGQGHKISHVRGGLLALVYVLGMAVTYAAIGVAAGLTGTLLSNLLQTPWALGGFALIFVVLSFSMFGFYELQLPSALQSKISGEAGHLQGGRGLGVLLMGALSALIVGPCVAAPLAGALLYIGQTGNAVLGGSALFAMALGMGVPLLVVGFAGGSLLPRTGPWMEAVKKAFGVLLLATALWIVSPVIPPVAEMLGWAALLIIPAIYLHALDPLPAQAKGWPRFWKGVGIVMLLTGAALLIGVLAGSRDPLQPLAGLRGQAAADETKALPFEPVASAAALDQRLASAGRPVMLDFYADWCVSCKELERFTFSDAKVRAKLAGYTLLRADVTANSAEDKALLARFQLFGPPGLIFFDARGQEIPGARIVGYQDAGQFMKSLDRIAAAL